MSRHFLLALISSLVIVSAGLADTNFYDLLGIAKSASTRDIRRAFKQAALKHHPDKSDEPDAHAKFVRINRAYEVLKDDDLRRKYDQHGEAGLEDKGGHGGQYQSWNYYDQDFGLYDDDPEIITLTSSDFDLLVSSSNDTWFINFYSPGCPPCHRLAPTWREVARDIDGVVRVGAVNCQEDRQLCMDQHIRSYPSLVLYPRHGDRYQGDRSKDALIQYVMQNVDVAVNHLGSSEFFESKTRPWLVHFCAASHDTDCLSDIAMLRLTGMMRNLMSVGHLDCDAYPSLCRQHSVASGSTVYFPMKNDKASEQPVQVGPSLDARELGSAAISLLPKARLFTEKSFDVVRRRIHAEPILVLFGEGQSTAEELEVRKLSLLLQDIEVGVVDCSTLQHVCAEYHVAAEATLLLKPTGHEFFYGKRQALDLAAFARESAQSNVRALGPGDFPQPVSQGESPFFVDFFAPWCPPCRRLLPQFRKAAMGVPSVRFGTVDCVVHQQLCRNYNVRSYPTTILFNSSVPHQYSGGHAAHEIIEFANDILAPSVVELDPEAFKRVVEGKDKETTVLVDFYSPHCGPCIKVAPSWNKLAKLLKGEMLVTKVDCSRHQSFCQQERLRGYPTIRGYPQGSVGKHQHQDYQGWGDIHSLRMWAFSLLPRESDTLDGQNFARKVLSRHDQPYVVLFSAGHWCGPCQNFLPVFEQLARRMKEERYIIGFGVVDCDHHRHTCGQAQINQYPMLKVYDGEDRLIHSGHVVRSQNTEEIYNFLLNNLQSLRRKPKKKKSTTGQKDEL